MDIEVIEHKVPLSRSRVTCYGALDVREKIRLGARWSVRWRYDTSGRHVEVDHE